MTNTVEIFVSRLSAEEIEKIQGCNTPEEFRKLLEELEIDISEYL